jgi:hypothetical protein
MIWSVLFGIFFILHALVHLLYAGQALRFFKLRPGLIWPDGAWALSRLFGEAVTRNLAAVFLAVTAPGFLAGSLGLFLGQGWWRAAVVAAAVLSIVTYLVFWNGKFQDLPDQGGVGLLISLGILVAVLLV